MSKITPIVYKNKVALFNADVRDLSILMANNGVLQSTGILATELKTLISNNGLSHTRLHTYTDPKDHVSPAGTPANIVLFNSGGYPVTDSGYAILTLPYWSLTGNAGTVDGTNFVGTTDNVPFTIRVNNQRSCRIDNTLENVSLGYQALNAVTTGGQCVAIGQRAMYSFTGNGQGNTVVGYQSGYTLDGNDADYNTFLGWRAGYSSTSVYNNTFLGSLSGYSNLTGTYNIFLGDRAGYYETGSGKLFIGGTGTTEADSRYLSFIYGVMNANPMVSQLYFNTKVSINPGSSTIAPTAYLHLAAGIDASGGSPLKLTSGVLTTGANISAGAIEMNTDDLYFTITTAAARKGIILNDGANLTNTFIPVATTNGRLVDTALTEAAVAGAIAASHARLHDMDNVLDHNSPGGTPGNLVVFDAAGYPVTDGGAIPAGGTNFANLVFVDPNGNDGTGAVGNAALPFLTIEAAVAAASSGDTVIVMPGAYTVATNLAKNGVTFYFYKDAVVTKTTAGAIFDFSTSGTYTSDINILGYGSFLHTTNIGEVLTINGNTNALTIRFEFHSCSATNSITINLDGANNKYIYLKGILCYSSGSHAITRLSAYSAFNTYLFDIDINKIYSTAGYAIYDNWTTIKVKADHVYSTTVSAVYHTAQEINIIDYDIAYCIGITYGYYLNLNTSYATIKGTYCTGVAGLVSGIITSLYTELNYLVSSAAVAHMYVQSFKSCAVSAGYVHCKSVERRATNTISVSGGTVVIDFIDAKLHSIWTSIAVTGTGDLTIRNAKFQPFEQITVSAGRLSIEKAIITAWGTPYDLVNLSGTGVLLLGNIKNEINQNTSRIVNKTGGTLILNTATLYKTNSYSQFINASASAQDIKIYSGGCNANCSAGEFLSAKARKDQVTVTAVAVTTIVLDDGSGGAETFTENDTVTYNTRALLAQRMAALINASGTLAITATQDTPGVDLYFYLEADVAGTNYTQSGLVNCTNTQLRLNGYALTDLTGGTLIEDTDVTF